MRNLFASLAIAVAFAPAVLAAQTATALAPASPAPAVVTAPTLSSSSSMVRSDVAGIHTTADANAPLVVSSAAVEGMHQGEGVALMAVGGAGLVAGLLIGNGAGSAIAIGGLAVGLVGLYEFVR